MISASVALDLTKNYPYERGLKMVEDMIIDNCKLGKTEVTMPLSTIDRGHLDFIIIELQCHGYDVGVELQCDNHGYGYSVLKIKWGY